MAKRAGAAPGLLVNIREVMRTCNLPEGRRPDLISRWLILTRACVQPMTLTAAAIAGLLAARAPGFRLELFAVAAVGIIVAHAANNLINDFFDLDLGQDTESYPRALYAPHPVLSGMITRGGLLRAILVLNAVDVVILALLVVERGWPVAAFAVAGLFISVFYVAPPLRLKLHGLGEPSVFLIWGPLMVGGTYYAATGTLPGAVVWASLPYALLVTSVLMGKHLDKAPWDREQGVRTLPVLLGDRPARRFTVGLVVAFYAAVAAEVIAGILPIWALAATAALPQGVRLARIYGAPKPADPPEDYPVWPLWFVSWAFRHSRRAGALFVLGLAAGAVWPVFVGA
jgi:1,4-dihydroxy-2-naphthoate octaprenyltransferase